jgi:hypothetical protein
MTVTFKDPVNVGVNHWRFRWTSTIDGATFRVAKNGKLITETSLRSITLQMLAGDVLDVSDDGSDPDGTPDGAVELAWAGVADAEKYRVEQETSPGSGTWNNLAVIRDDGRSQYKYKTAPLVDDTATSFRVTPVGTNGNDGAASTINVTVPRHPSTPDVDYAFSDASKTVTITAS